MTDERDMRDLGIAGVICFAGVVATAASPFVPNSAYLLSFGQALFWVSLGYALGRAA